MFKRKMRLRFHGERTDYPSLTFTEDCNFVQGIFRNWRDNRCAYRKFRHVASSGFKMNFKPPTYANCKDGSKHKKVRESNRKVDGKQNDLPVDKMPPKGRTKHKKNVVRKRVLPQKKILPKTIKKKVIFKNAVKNIRKKVEEKPAKLAKENDKQEKQKPAPIGDTLGPIH
ncbi:hypothetical protein Ddc_12140 [Ditylenchus destructor]|nr:hypothetical protein Ddc_12140 [Ditylenchus destructor]